MVGPRHGDIRMRVTYLWLAVVAVMAVSASGCSTIKNFTAERKVDYRAAKTLPPLRIPPELVHGSDPGGRLSVPAPPPDQQVVYGRAPGAEPFATPAPGALGAPTRQWLIVSGEPAERWVQVREFLNESGLEVLVADAETGILETGWVGPQESLSSDFERLLAPRGDPGSRDKFEVRVTVGDQPATTAIQVSHRALAQAMRPEEGTAGAWSWESRAPDSELEAGVLGLLAQRLGVQATFARRAEPSPSNVPAASTRSAERVVLRRSSDGVPALTIRDDYDQAWRRVGESLEQLGMTVAGRDPDGGIYYVRYLDPDRPQKKKSFWHRIIPPRGKDKDGPEEYQVKLTSAGTVSLVTIRDSNGVPDRSQAGEKILSMLHEQLR